jgi:hypothetical protein
MTDWRMLPFLLSFALAVIGLVGEASRIAGLRWSLLGAAAALLVWASLLMWTARRTGRVLSLDVVLKKQHYLQACAQGTVLHSTCAGASTDLKHPLRAHILTAKYTAVALLALRRSLFVYSMLFAQMMLAVASWSNCWHSFSVRPKSSA